MENNLLELEQRQVSQSLTKVKPAHSLTTYQKLRAAVMATAFLGGAWGAAHLAGYDEFLDPTLPLATDAELNQANYPRFEDTEYPDRTKMMEVLSQRINVKIVCTITTRSYGQVHVFADRPWDLSEGVEEIETGNNDTVLPTCIRLIQERFSHGRARSVTYTMSIGSAWGGSSSAPTVGPFERNDENGNGVNYESTPYSLGNEWHDESAIDRLEEAQQNYIDLKEALRNRDSRSILKFSNNIFTKMARCDVVYEENMAWWWQEPRYQRMRAHIDTDNHSMIDVFEECGDFLETMDDDDRRFIDYTSHSGIAIPGIELIEDSPIDVGLHGADLVGDDANERLADAIAQNESDQRWLVENYMRVAGQAYSFENLHFRYHQTGYAISDKIKYTIDDISYWFDEKRQEFSNEISRLIRVPTQNPTQSPN